MKEMRVTDRAMWNKVVLICGNHEDNEHIMEIKQPNRDTFYAKRSKKGAANSAFYGCKEFRSIYVTDHSIKSCNNRLSVDMFLRLVERIMQEEQENDDGLCDVSLVGMKFDDHYGGQSVSYEIIADPTIESDGESKKRKIQTEKDKRYYVRMYNHSAVGR